MYSESRCEEQMKKMVLADRPKRQPIVESKMGAVALGNGE